MLPLRLKLQNECVAKQVAQHVIEKDYALSYVLAGITLQSELSRCLIFKGGTALKKIYFGAYRFSEDLDFSVINAPKGNKLEKTLQEAIKYSEELLTKYGPFVVLLRRNPERSPHPRGQEDFNIFVKFPWHPRPMCRIKIEITHDEPVILSPENKAILHGYNEEFNYFIACYKIEEIVAEKLRALLQTHQNLMLRGWNRPRARDYYDLWRILKNYHSVIDRRKLLETLKKKCLHRNVAYECAEDFFTAELLKEAHQHWQTTLGVLVRDLPECETVISETKKLIEKFL